jgi:predicted GH43/DUF377 family glycosyl hydrolase
MKNKYIKHSSGPILAPKGNPFLYYPGNWEGRWVYNPRVIKHNGIYYLFYTGKSGVNFLLDLKIQLRQDIGVQTSKDLLKWERLANNPVLSPSSVPSEWDSDLVAHPFILKNKDRYFMYYDGSQKGDWKESIGIAVSKNLTNWTKLDKPVLQPGPYKWNKKHVSRCCVINDSKGDFYMYFAGHDGDCERIGLAKSSDGLKWKKVSECPVIDLGDIGEWDSRFVSDPRVIKVGEYYLMFYTGYKSTKASIGIAFSKDLLSWKRFRNNPILSNGVSGSWNQDESSRPEILKDNDEYYMFFTGVKHPIYKIGFVKLNMKKIVEDIKNDK